MIGNTADETNIPNKSLLTDKQASKLLKDYTYDLSANMNSSKTHISKTTQLGGLLGRLLSLLIKVGWPLIENVIKPLAKIVLIPLALAVAVSAADSRIQKQAKISWLLIFWS